MITKVSALGTRTNYSQSFQGRENGRLKPMISNVETVVPKKSGSMIKTIRAMVAALCIGAAGLTAASCAADPIMRDQIEAPVTPTKPPTTTAAEETNAAITSTLEKLNPIIEDSSVNKSIVSRSSSTSDTLTNMVKGFSYEDACNVEDFTVTSVDQNTGVVTAHHTSTEVDTKFVDTDEIVTLSKTDKGFKMKYSNGAYQEFIPLDIPVQRTNVGNDGTIALVRNLKKGATQGEVLLYDTAGKLWEVMKNFKLKK